MASTQNHPSIHRVAHNAAIRMTARAWLAGFARMLVCSLPVGFIVIVTLRQGLPRVGIDAEAASLWISWWMVVLISFFVPLALSVVRLRKFWISEAQGAGVLDDRFGLESRIRSAIELERDSDPDEVGFVEITNRQAARAIEQIDLRRVGDRAPGPVWSMIALAGVLCVVAGLWLPAPSGAVANRASRISMIPDRAIAQIDTVRQELAVQAHQAPEEQDALSKTQSELEALREELAEGVQSEKEAEARAAAMLDKLADDLDQSAQDEQEQADALSEAVLQAINAAKSEPGQRDDQGDRADPSGMDPELAGDSVSDVFDEFAQAMSEQRFDDAADAIEELQERAGDLSQEEREAIAERFEALADSIEQEPSQSQPEAVPEQAESSDDSSQGPESRENDPVNDFAESIRDESQRMRRDSPDQPGQSDQDSQSPDSDSPPTADEDSEESADSPNAPKQDQQQTNQQENDQQRESKEQSGTNKQTSSGKDEDLKNDPNQRRDDRTGSEQSDRQVQDRTGRQTKQSDQRRELGQSESPKQDAAAEQGEERVAEEDSDQPPQQRDRRVEQDGSDDRNQGDQKSQEPNQERGDQKSLQERLEEMHRRSERGREQQDTARRIREQARKLIDPADADPGGDSPGHTRDDGSAQPPRGGGAESEEDPDPAPIKDPNDVRNFIPVDGRDTDAAGGGQPMGKWYAPEGDGQDPQEAGQAARRLRQAAQDAQRAIDQQQVPRRYRHLVREVFKRVDQRADQIEHRQVAPQGQDAVPSRRSGQPESTGGDG